MDVKEAAKTAASYVAEMESISGNAADNESEAQVLQGIRFAVEGTHFNETNNCWEIEIGFARKWDQASSSPLAGLSGSVKDNRAFKTVVIDDSTGNVLSYGN